MKLLLSVSFPNDQKSNNADPEGSPDNTFLKFLKVLKSMNITQPERCIIYSFINGVCYWHDNNESLGAMEEELNSLPKDLVNLVNTIERSYVSYLTAEGETDPNNAHMQAFQSTFHEITVRIGQEMPDADTADWCNGLFYAGILAERSGMAIAQGCIKKRDILLFPSETFLYNYMSNLEAGIPYIGVGPVMQQFLNSCYPATPIERRVIAGEAFSNFYDKITKNGECLSLGRAFFEFQAAGLKLGREEKDKRDEMLEDIETHLLDDEVSASRDIILRHLGPHPLELRPDEIWDGTRNLISTERRIPLELLNENQNSILSYSYFQWMVDAAFWTGLYAAEPEAFDRD
jgi:hypothetical protein